MTTLLEYCKLADAAYDKGPLFKGGWKCQRRNLANPYGFKGAVYYSESTKETVIAFAGTNPKSAQDLGADVKLALGYMPDQQRSALRLTQSVVSSNITLVGHSLGGGLAQTVGERLGHRFVTFNAPGMKKTTLAGALTRFIQRRKGFNSLVSEVEGYNYRFRNDPVSKSGKHIGEVVVLDKGGGTRA